MNTLSSFRNHVAFVAIAASLTAASVHAQISEDVVRIGVMADLSGPYSGNGGIGQVIAARMAVEDFGGKVNGKPIEVLSIDDQNKPDVGLNAARKWLDTDKVDTMVIGSASSIALGVQTLMKERQKPVLFAGPVTADLTGKSCSPMGTMWVPDTYSLPKAGVRALMNQGAKTFFFVTVDYAFGTALQESATKFITEAGGKVLGAAKHPLGATDFSAYLLQAQSSGADAVVILNAGLDLSNALKQASEFRIGRSGGKQVVSIFGMTINSVSAMGLETAQGLTLTLSTYWDSSDEQRAWAKRFMERYKEGVPTHNMTRAYTAVMHYLKAVQAAGTDAGPAVVAKMKEMPINSFEFKNVRIREDGQVMQPLYVVKIKSPAESKYRYDHFTVTGTIAPEEAFRPMSEGGCDFVKK